MAKSTCEIHLEMTETEAERAGESGIFQIPASVVFNINHLGMPVAKAENLNAVKPSRSGQGTIIHGGIDTNSEPFFIIHCPNLIVGKKRPMHEAHL